MPRHLGIVLVLLVLGIATAIPLSEKGDTSLGRLPVHLQPIHYNIELQPDIFTNSAPPFPFSGTVEISFEVKQTTGIIYLNSIYHGVDGASIDLSVHPDSPVQADPPTWSRWELDTTLEFFKLFVDQDLTEGAHYVIKMAFNGTLRDDGFGLYYDSYEEDGQTKYVVSTQFQMTYTRFVFPCFDEPGFKATYDVTLVHKNPWTALSNMPDISREDREDDWVADKFNTTVKMSAYLLCFTICDYLHKEMVSDNGHLVRVWARRDLIDQVDYGMPVAAAYQDWFENFTGVAYPLPKMDHIALPSKGGAMENWGLVTYGENALLYDPEVHLYRRKLVVARIIGHEIAHMWFGNLVTCKWWDDTWLNEAFASLFETYPLPDVAKIPSVDLQVVQHYQFIMDYDDDADSRSVRNLISTPWDARTAFSPFTYSKGGTIVRALQNVVGGREIFRKGIQRYLNRHAYDSVITADLWQAMTEQAEEDGIKDTDGSKLYVAEKMDPWIDQRGYPAVTVEREAAGTAKLSQWQFLIPKGQTTPISPFDYEWYIPLTVQNQDDSGPDETVKEYLNRENKTITAGQPDDLGKWVVFNVMRNGFWRVQYDNQTLSQLSQQLVDNDTVFTTVDKASFINDAFRLGRPGYQKEVLAMDLLKYIDKEDSFTVWVTVDRQLTYQAMVLARYSSDGDFQSWLRTKLDPVYQRLGWTDQEADETWIRMTRAVILWYACNYGNSECVPEARQRYDDFKVDPENNRIASNQRATVYCTALNAGDTADWQFLYNYYNATVADSKEQSHIWGKTDLLAGLACTANQTLLQRYLDHILNPAHIRAGDATTSLLLLAESHHGRWVVWQHLKTNWRDNPVPAQTNKYTVLNRVVEGFANGQDETELNDFIAQYPPEGQDEQAAYDEALAIVAENKRWADDNESELRDWFQAQPSLEVDFHPGMQIGASHRLRSTLEHLDDSKTLGQHSTWFNKYKM